MQLRSGHLLLLRHPLLRDLPPGPLLEGLQVHVVLPFNRKPSIEVPGFNSHKVTVQCGKMSPTDRLVRISRMARSAYRGSITITRNDYLKNFSLNIGIVISSHKLRWGFIKGHKSFIASSLLSSFLLLFFKWRHGQVRTLVSDFAVIIAILVFVGVDELFLLETPKLIVPTVFKVRNPSLYGQKFLIISLYLSILFSSETHLYLKLSISL